MFIGRFAQRLDVLAYALSWPILPWTLWGIVGPQWGVCVET